jgi:Rps23 Pro-64 3,4-dihydroxylase Tpa1-like proline 4-hydroxylase
MRLTLSLAIPEAVRSDVTDDDELRGWIQPQHLAEDAVSTYRARFQEHPAKLLVIHEFLVDEIAAKLTRFLRDEARYQEEFGVYSTEGAVSHDRYEGADEDDRFFRLSRLAGIPDAHRFSPNAMTYLRLRQTFQRPAFESYFEALTGLSLGSSDDFGTHRMRAGDYLKAHSDDNKDRRLALVMYLTPDWKPEYGGGLHMLDAKGNETTVDAAFNSIVLFDVLAETSHFVAPVDTAAGDASRLTIGGWYHRAD